MRCKMVALLICELLDSAVRKNQTRVRKSGVGPVGRSLRSPVVDAKLRESGALVCPARSGGQVHVQTGEWQG